MINQKKVILIVFLALGILTFLYACKTENKTKKKLQVTDKEVSKEPFFKVSLAQWSMHRMIENGDSPFNFASKAKAMKFEGLEYVSQLYSKEIAELGFDVVIDSLKKESEKHQIKNVLIMVDGEGDLANPDLTERNQTVENHKKWVDAAQFLGCHAIRVNLFGTNDPEEWQRVARDGLLKLSTYAASKNINVLVENHGWLSSNPSLLIKVINSVDKPNCGTLPDFGNWCLKRSKGERWGECIETYPDKYKGVAILMSAAKAVSAKSYNFDNQGNETTIDYKRMLQIVKDLGYKGYIGIEYEGSNSSETEGIALTRDLLLQASTELN